MRRDNTELFETMPVSKAIAALVIPTILGQIITVVYNVADTFFIGQMNDPNQVAAATLVMPPFVMLTGIANLFGIGGSSLVSRCLGAGDRDKAQKSAAFSIWISILVAFVYGLVIYAVRPSLFRLLGADSSTFDYCASYTLWTVTVGGVPTVLSAVLSHLVRAEGYSKESSFGIMLGGVLNIILDPLLIFPLKLGVTGAAIATMLSNLIATCYFLQLLYRHRKSTVLKLHPRYVSAADGIAKEVLLVGLPSFASIFLATFSNSLLNKMAAAASNQVVAGVGIAKKVDLLAFAVAMGLTQGVLPLVGYNYAAENYKRMREVVRKSFFICLVESLICTLILFFGAVPLVRIFIQDAATVASGQLFLRALSTTSVALSVGCMVISIFQGIGQKSIPLVLTFLRKGGLDIPFMLILHRAWGVRGLAWATPFADCITLVAAVCLFVPYWKKICAKAKEKETV